MIASKRNQDPGTNISTWALGAIRGFIFLAAIATSLWIAEIVLETFSPRELDLPLEQQLANAVKDRDRMDQHSTVTKLFDPLFHHSSNPKTVSQGELEGHPYTFTINGQGSRSIEDFEEKKSPNTYRIALLGDSFTAGLYVNDDETYAAQLQGMLAQIPRPLKWQAYNFGSTSYSPLIYSQQYKHTVQRYRPDLLIIAMDNSDLQDDFYYEQDAIFDADGNLVRFRDVHYAFFMGQVRDIRTPQERVEAFYKKMGSPWIRFTAWLTSHFQWAVHLRDLFKKDSLRPGDIESDRIGHTREGVDWAQHWRRTEKYLAQTVRMAKDQGVAVLILYYPYPHQINGTDWPGRQQMGYQLGKVYDTPMRRWLSDFARQQNVDFLDTVDVFLKSNETPISFKSDPHFRPSGHRILATALGEHIINHYNPPKTPVKDRLRSRSR